MTDKVEGVSPGSGSRPRLSLGNKERFDEALSAAGVERTKPKPLPEPQESGGQPPPPSPPPPR